MTYYRKTGDTESPIDDVLTDEDESTIDLTGATVRFKLWEQGKRGSPTVVDDTDGNVSIPEPTAGRVVYDFQDGDLTSAGSYRYEWEVTFANGGRETWPNHIEGAPLRVIEDAGEPAA